MTTMFSELQEQISGQRRSVGFDSYDLSVKQIADMVAEDQILIAPEYQRHFVWDSARQSELIESLFLGIPVPSLFFATNDDSTWEVVDGLQRITTLLNYIATDLSESQQGIKIERLKITGLSKLSGLNGKYFSDLPKSLSLMFMTRPLRVTVLNDKSVVCPLKSGPP